MIAKFNEAKEYKARQLYFKRIKLDDYEILNYNISHITVINFLLKYINLYFLVNFIFRYIVLLKDNSCSNS